MLQQNLTLGSTRYMHVVLDPALTVVLHLLSSAAERNTKLHNTPQTMLPWLYSIEDCELRQNALSKIAYVSALSQLPSGVCANS